MRHGQPRVDDPARTAFVSALGMDETAWLRANRHHHTTYVSGLVDTATGRLLDVVPDRTATAVMGWLSRRDRRWLARVGVVTLDPHRGYANAVGVHLGHAVLVVDHFHIIKLANTATDEVRRRVHNDKTGHRGRKHDPLYRIRTLLLNACDNLLYTWADTSGIRELRRFAGTVRRWQTEILNWHITGGASNGPTEAVNLAIKRTKRVGRGFRNVDNYRLRLLLHCGGIAWQDQPAARLRGRRPQLVA